MLKSFVLKQVWFQDETFRAGVYACLPPANGNIKVCVSVVGSFNLALTVLFNYSIGFTAVSTSSSIRLPSEFETSCI